MTREDEIRARAEACNFGSDFDALLSFMSAVPNDIPYLLDQNARLRAALLGLLRDTQHVEHDCGEVDCPVAIARALLAEDKP